MNFENGVLLLIELTVLICGLVLKRQPVKLFFLTKMMEQRDTGVGEKKIVECVKYWMIQKWHIGNIVLMMME